MAGLVASAVFASEVTGTINTGLGNAVEGTVIVSPTANPVAGTYTLAQSVTLTATGATSVRYTDDGTTPTCASTQYLNTISVASSKTIKAISCYPNNQSSSIVSFAYTINIPSGDTTTGGTTTGGGGGGGGMIIPPPTTSISLLSAAAQKVDANKDNKIDVLDFNVLMINFGSTSVNNAADFNGDNKVDVFDFNLLMINWIF